MAAEVFDQRKETATEIVPRKRGTCRDEAFRRLHALLSVLFGLHLHMTISPEVGVYPSRRIFEHPVKQLALGTQLCGIIRALYPSTGRSRYLGKS